MSDNSYNENAYNGFAYCYDLFMDNVPYEEWGSYLTGLLREYGICSGTVAELGCGTGKMTRLLAAAGYDMIGVDNSEEMLEIAREAEYEADAWSAAEAWDEADETDEPEEYAELGEPDESGRRRPVVKEGSEFELPMDCVIMALGTSPNPLLKKTTPGLETKRRGEIVADENGLTSIEGVYAGGDAVTGAATVILAMGAGKTAAAAMDAYIKGKNA